MFIKKYMTRDPVSIAPHMLILDARKILIENEFRHLPVTDNRGILLGIVTDRDIRSALPSSIASRVERKQIMDRVKVTPVSRIMSVSLNILRLDSTLDDALILLTSSNVGALPVVDSESVVKGIFSIRDLMKAYGSLFGLGEKGNFLVTIEAEKGAYPLNRASQLLSEHGIAVTRIVQEEVGAGKVLLHLRVSTLNIRAVHAALEHETSHQT